MKSNESETQRKKALETNSLLASIVESSDDAIIGKTLDGTILNWNSGAQKIYGYSADEVKGRSISILVPFLFWFHQTKQMRFPNSSKK
jgi:PAS domain S-box-containing protein